MRAFWTVALVLTLVPPVAAQLREVRPPLTAFAFGWSDVTGYGTAIALLHRLPRAPVGLGVAGVEWAALLGSELWPDTRPGLFFDFGYGVVGTIGGDTPGGHGGGITLRFLMGWAF